MTPRDVRALSLKTFWLMQNNIDRLKAQDDMRALSIARAAQATPEGAQDMRDRLDAERGQVVVVDEGAQRQHERLDRPGLDALRQSELNGNQ